MPNRLDGDRHHQRQCEDDLMSAHFLQAFFIVWRECVEALLVVGILHAWLRAVPNAMTTRCLWIGVAAGFALAAVLGGLLLSANTVLPETGQAYLQVAITGLAAVLIVQMVTWIRTKGRTLRRDLEQRLGEADGSGWRIGTLAALAVAREGSETVIFLYGIGSVQTGGALQAFLGGVAMGLAAAGVTYSAVLLARRFLPARLFFGVTEVLLLCLGSALTLATLDGVASLGLLPADWPGALYDPLWDSSAIVPDNTLGGLLSAFTGYRSRPSIIEIGVYALYWSVVAMLILRRPASRTVHA